MGWAFAWGMMFKHSRHKAGFFLFLITLLFSTWCLLHINPVQNWLVTNVSKTLSKELKTKVEIKHVDFSLFNKMLVQGVLIEDRKKDTLLYADALKVNITDWFFFEDNITLKYVGLAGAKINMNRTDSVWNYQFLVDYFVAPKKTARTAKGPIEIDLKVIDLDNVTINRVDKWAGQDLKGSVKKLHLTADDFDLTKKIIEILKNEEIQSVIADWNKGRLQSYLLEITTDIFGYKEEDGSYLIDKIKDEAKSKGTGKWTTQIATDLELPIPTIDMAVAMRNLSKYKSLRTSIAAAFPAEEKHRSIPGPEFGHRSFFYSFDPHL